ncbi:hypothetical protein [Variovorax guangxiensis]|uniref:Uncharacterized protein n=1 Tax=Variovorax guangxiensis TaxID=1775474 RepID=A0A840FVG3_9BURK|nr:hypothetical protein [Variovorax guangxiensis]MBB4223439.1 hypothetical protein [Variovorax guangxiensis]
MTSRSGKRRASGEPIIRYGFVTAWDLNLHAWSGKENTNTWKRTDSLYLTLRGEFTEDVSGSTKFDFLIYAEPRLYAGRTTIPSIGSFLRCKPILEAVVILSEQHFQAMVSVAAAGKLNAVKVIFEKLRYGHGSISSMELSTGKEIE